VQFSSKVLVQTATLESRHWKTSHTLKLQVGHREAVGAAVGELVSPGGGGRVGAPEGAVVQAVVQPQTPVVLSQIGTGAPQGQG
jgi:hypothetical protein